LKKKAQGPAARERGAAPQPRLDPARDDAREQRAVGHLAQLAALAQLKERVVRVKAEAHLRAQRDARRARRRRRRHAEHKGRAVQQKDGQVRPAERELQRPRRGGQQHFARGPREAGGGARGRARRAPRA
jgi:hypothetical protein